MSVATHKIFPPRRNVAKAPILYFTIGVVLAFALDLALMLVRWLIAP